MDMADYSEALDPAYTTLEFENMQVLPLGTGESHSCSSGGLNFETFTDFKLCCGEVRGSLAPSDNEGHLSIRADPSTHTAPSFITSGPDSSTLRALWVFMGWLDLLRGQLGPVSA